MKAVTLHQPWASLVAIGAKRIETRSWATEYRGPIAIHAGRTVTADSRAASIIDPTQLPRGHVVATGVLTDCVPMVGAMDPPPETGAYIEIAAHATFLVGRFSIPMVIEQGELDLGDYRPGRFGWLIDGVQLLKHPIPMRGHQGLWDIATRR